MRTFLVIFPFFLVPTLGCLLCLLQLPPRPRSIDHFQLPSVDNIESPDSAAALCNATKVLRVSEKCREGVTKIFCALADFIDAKSADCDSADVDYCAKCSRHSSRVASENFWVLAWLDSVGKMPAGISEGNYYWLGDYEECLNLKETGSFDGQYCQVLLDVPDSRVDAGCPQTDPLEIHLGLCSPSHCSVDEIAFLIQPLSPYKLSVKCETLQEWPLSSKIFISISVIWITVLLAATAVDVYTPYEHPPDHAAMLAECLSLRLNGRRAMSTRRNHDYHAVQGLQVISLAIIVTASCYYYMMPYIENVQFSYENVHFWTMHPLNNFSFHVDGLIAVNALFTTLLLKTILSSTLDVKKVYFKRFLQVWPSFAFVTLFMIIMFERLASGPLWHHSERISRCEKYGWKNILFINNLFSVRETCLDGGYLIALEAQFFLILAPLVYLALRFWKAILTLSICATGASVAYVFAVVYSKSLPPSIVLTANPLPAKEVEIYIDDVYMKPWSRLPALLIGFLFAFIFKGRSKLNKALSVLFWIVLFGFAMFIIFALLPYASKSTGNQLFISLYSALHRPAWSTLICSIVYMCHRRSAGEFGVFLEWRLFTPLAKLLYLVFVVCEPISVYLFSSLHRPTHATHWSTLYIALGTIILSYIVALAVDVLISRPVRNVINFELGMRLQKPISQSQLPSCRESVE